MLRVIYSNRFKRSYRKLRKSGLLFREDAERVVALLTSLERLPEKYRDHALTGNWVGYRECHIKPDLLLIYRIEKNELVLLLVDIGSHSTLFK